MSLLQHLQCYYENWMEKTVEINTLFGSRPPMEFTIYPEEEEITGIPFITMIPVKQTYTTIPDTDQFLLIPDYYRECCGYEVSAKDVFSINFDTVPTRCFSPESIYLNDIEEYQMYLANPFTYVV